MFQSIFDAANDVSTTERGTKVPRSIRIERSVSPICRSQPGQTSWGEPLDNQRQALELRGDDIAVESTDGGVPIHLWERDGSLLCSTHPAQATESIFKLWETFHHFPG